MTDLESFLADRTMGEIALLIFFAVSFLLTLGVLLGQTLASS